MTPITTLAKLSAIDSDDCVDGYKAGFNNTPDYTRRGHYWHGYMNGQVDAGHMPISNEQRELARVVVASWHNH